VIILLAAGLCGLAPGGETGKAGSRADPPISLVAVQNDGRLALTVVGRSAVEFRGSYVLEVESGPGGNRSTNRGGVTLSPGATVTLARVDLAPIGAGGWSARLRVSSEGGESYECAGSAASDRANIEGSGRR
jgi:hypothetical protein